MTTNPDRVFRDEVTVRLAEFRRALVAVAPHASKDKERPALRRVRLHLAAEGGVLVSATDSYTGMLVKVDAEVPSDLPDFVDIADVTVPKILSVFPAPKSEQAEDMLLQLKVSTETLRLTDISGIVDGESLTVDRIPTEWAFPDLRLLTGRYLRSDLEPYAGGSYLPDFIKRFFPACKTYASAIHTLRFTHGKALLVQCGPAIGFMSLTGRDAETGRDELTDAYGLIDHVPAPHNPNAEAEDADPAWIDAMYAHLADEAKKADAEPTGVPADQILAAAELVITTQFGSQSMLQRKLHVGLARAIALIDALEQLAVIGPKNGTNPREVLTKPDDLDAALARIRTELEGGDDAS